jgi:hypothetical protein
LLESLAHAESIHRRRTVSASTPALFTAQENTSTSTRVQPRAVGEALEARRAFDA